MHPHHKRALRIARRNYAFCKGVVERKHEAYLMARYAYTRFPSNGRFDLVKAHMAALERALEELQNQLSVVLTVERLLEKA